MKPALNATQTAAFRRYRLRLMVALMLVTVLVTTLGLYLAGRHALAGARRELLAECSAVLAASQAARETRTAQLAQRCRLLADNPRIHAALEDDALDLLYISARDELADLMHPEPRVRGRNPGIRARFYRFLDARGAVIPVHDVAAGEPIAATRLSLPRVPTASAVGYLPTGAEGPDGTVWDEIITTPIVSTISHQPISALVVGLVMEPILSNGPIARGLWGDGYLTLPGLSPRGRAALAALLPEHIRQGTPAEDTLPVRLDDQPFLLMVQSLNPQSPYPPTYEVFLYPLAAAKGSTAAIRRQVFEGGILLLLAGLVISHFAAVRLARPVEELARDSETNAFQRTQAEAALEMTQAELARSARFAANASHQLKTPVAVMRAGLDELLARDDLAPDLREELVSLAQEGARFTDMIEDLLLLSRMDAGRLQIQFQEVDLMHALAACLDDYSVLPDPFALKVTTTGPSVLGIAGEKRYIAHILQNLIENARNYNRPDGRIEVAVRTERAVAILTIGNTGRSIPPDQQAHIFDRFLRGATTQDLPGHGLGLNLARELARLHRGDLRLRDSREDWTEFEVLLPLWPATPAA